MDSCGHPAKVQKRPFLCEGDSANPAANPGAMPVCLSENQLTVSLAFQLDVLFSPSSVPGEGEHKAMEFIRSQRQQPGYIPVRHAFYGPARLVARYRWTLADVAQNRTQI
jgi:hypothetical protein